LYFVSFLIEYKSIPAANDCSIIHVVMYYCEELKMFWSFIKCTYISNLISFSFFQDKQQTCYSLLDQDHKRHEDENNNKRHASEDENYNIKKQPAQPTITAVTANPVP
jgi:hypothetical protein